MSPSVDMAVYLTTKGFTLGGDADWCMNIAAEPDRPNNTITFSDQTGGMPDTDELDLLNVRVQVRVKAMSYPDGYAKAEEIRDLIALVQPLEMNGSMYIGWNLESDIWSLGRNDNGQHLIVMVFAGIKQRTN